MKKLLSVFALILILAGCATQYPTSAPSPSTTYDPFREPAETALRRQALTQQLSELRAYQKQAQSSLGGGTSSDNAAAASDATVGDLQTQIDYLEDQLASMPAIGSSTYLLGTLSHNPSYDTAPCVTGSCGSVSVRGYYRKDGTYVRPHTRSRPWSGGGRSRGRR